MIRRSSLLEKAQNFLKQSKMGKAVREYEKIVQMDSGDLTALNILGDLYMKQGQRVKALRAFEDTAKSYAREGVTVKAIAVFKKIIRIAPEESMEAYIRLADLYLQQGLIGEAIENLRFILEHNRKNEYQKDAAETIKRILDIKPELSKLRKELANIYFKLGKIEDAHEELSLVALELLRKEKYDESKEIFNQLLEKDPENLKVLCGLSEVYNKKGMVDKALAILQKALKIEPSHAESIFLIAKLLIQNGEIEKGRKYLQTFLEISPKDTVGKLLYARTCLKRKKLEEAGKEYFELAQIFFQRKDFDKSIETMQEFIREDPGNIRAHEQLADFYAKTNNEKMVEEEHRNIAEIYGGMGKLQEASNILKKIVQDNPTDMKSRELLKKYSVENITVESDYEEDGTVFVELPDSDDLEDMDLEVSQDSFENIKESDTNKEEIGELNFQEIDLGDTANLQESEFGDIDLDLQDESLEPVKDKKTLEVSQEESSEESEEIDIKNTDFTFEGLEGSDISGEDVDFQEIDLGDTANLQESEFGDIDLDLQDELLEPVKDENTLEVVDESLGLVEDKNKNTPEVSKEDLAEIDLGKAKFTVDDSANHEVPAGELINLGDEIREEIKAEKHAEGLGKYEIGDIITEFRKKVSENIDNKDYTTHYNLGIAYKEMGLLKEAVQEFEISKNTSEFRLESFEMIGECALANNNTQKAIEAFKKGFSCKGYASEKRLGILYRLGCAYEKISDCENARETFQKVYVKDPNFADIRERIQALNKIDDNNIPEKESTREEEEDLFDPSTLLDD